MLRAHSFRAGRDLYRATPAVTRSLGFSGPVEAAHSVASYDAQGDLEDLFIPGSSWVGKARVCQNK
jgi:hypothetical protein